MGVRLSVQRAAWLDHVAGVAAGHPGLVPVVKGNGYGFGRAELMPFAAELVGPGERIAVGSVHEAADVPVGRTPWVLTPHVGPLPPTLPETAVLTVGTVAQVDALRQQRWAGRVVVKLASSMRRHGAAPAELAAVQAAIADAGLTPAGYALHLPLAGTDAERTAEVVAWLDALDPDPALSVSHLGPATYATLRAEHPHVDWTIRIGTALWHGDKELLHLDADVLDVRAVDAGITAGYRAGAVPGRGSLVLIAAGSAHGVRPLDDGRSPFHFARQRLALVEPPHMHTSIAFVPAGGTVPTVGDRVDVQRPLITTAVDELVWVDD